MNQQNKTYHAEETDTRRLSGSTVVSLVLKVIIFVSAVVGTIISAGAGRAAFMGGGSVFMYFTIQSNLALALICAIGFILLLRREEISNVWYVIKYVGTISITLTGLVFCFVLAPTLGDRAWNLQNILTHVVVPILCIVDFFITGVHSQLKKRHVFYVMLPPLAYAVYAGIGFVCDWRFTPTNNYPYFFLNWGSPAGAFGFTNELPFMGCGWWIIAILIFLVLVGLLYLWILKMLKRRTENRRSKE